MERLYRVQQNGERVDASECVGLNYKDHALEQGKPLPAEPLIFIKPRTAVVGPGDPIRLPPGVGRVDHEAELGVVIGRRAHRVARQRPERAGVGPREHRKMLRRHGSRRWGPATKQEKKAA